jgi:hypothetical protein
MPDDLIERMAQALRDICAQNPTLIGKGAFVSGILLAEYAAQLKQREAAQQPAIAALQSDAIPARCWREAAWLMFAPHWTPETADALEQRARVLAVK